MSRRSCDGGGGDVVVDGGDGAVGAADLAAGEAQAVEGLGRGDLVDEVEIDVEEAGSPAGSATRCGLPDFFEEGARCVVSWFVVMDLSFLSASGGSW